MNIPVNYLREAINEQMEEVKNEIGSTPSAVTIQKLGLISSLVLRLYDKVEEQEIKDEIWELKREADELFQKLMGF